MTNFYSVISSDVKRGQILEAEARPRTNRRGQGLGRGQTFEAEDEAEDKT